MIVGVDGCKGGWLGMWVGAEGVVKHRVFPDITSLWTEFQSAKRILVDIPIGLLEVGKDERTCDRQARKILGKPRGSSVFRVPCRTAVYHLSYHTASSVNKDLTGKNLSKQSFSIIPKIREVDKLLISDHRARRIFREVHPELSLCGLNKGTPMAFNKKSARGYQERLKTLNEYWENATGIVQAILASTYRNIVARDDIIDAFAILLTGQLPEGNLTSLPKIRVRDKRGLPMEIMVGIPDSQD